MSFAMTIALIPAILVVAVSVAGVLRLCKIFANAGRQIERQEQQDTPKDTVFVPVSATFICKGPLPGMARNSIWPSLLITPTGIQFRVLIEKNWSFSEISQVDVRKTRFGGVRLVFAGGGRRIFTAKVRDLTAARTALAALPHNLPLSVNAAIIRDGTDTAATPGLPRYRGPIQ